MGTGQRGKPVKKAPEPIGSGCAAMEIEHQLGFVACCQRSLRFGALYPHMGGYTVVDRRYHRVQ